MQKLVTSMVSSLLLLISFNLSAEEAVAVDPGSWDAFCAEYPERCAKITRECETKPERCGVMKQKMLHRSMRMQKKCAEDQERCDKRKAKRAEHREAKKEKHREHRQECIENADAKGCKKKLHASKDKEEQPKN